MTKKPHSKTMPHAGKPAGKAAGKPTPERKQGKTGASGINTPVKAEKVPQEVAKQRFGRPSQTQKL